MATVPTIKMQNGSAKIIVNESDRAHWERNGFRIAGTEQAPAPEPDQAAEQVPAPEVQDIESDPQPAQTPKKSAPRRK